MTGHVQFRSARVMAPLVLSGLVAVGAIASCGWALGDTDADAATGMVQRLFGNGFVVLIGVVGVWSLVFGVLQLWGFQSGPSSLMARLAGHTCPAPSVVVAQEASVSAGLFSERWDHLAAIRLAPLSYAIWVLPLLGFIGTVIGISDAIGDLGDVFADSAREEALASVLGALQFAFDTTFAGLVLVIPVMALTTAVSLKFDAARDAALATNFGDGGDR